MSAATVQLVARALPYGTADLRTVAGLVSLWLCNDMGRMGFRLDISPACARELGKALLAQAAAIEQAAADQAERGAA